MTQTDVPAVQAALGKEGFFEGLDYRGVPVVSVVLPIQGSNWYMVTKIDREEAFAEWNTISSLFLTFIALLIALIFAAWLILWHRSKKSHFEELYKSELTLRLSMAEHDITLKSIGDGVITTDSSGIVSLLNPVAEKLTGWKKEEARGKPLAEVFPIVNEYTREMVENPVGKVLKEGKIVGLANHTVLIAKDGTELPIADSGAPILDDDGKIKGVVMVFRDQSDERLTNLLLQKRLELNEYSHTHSLDELMVKTLDILGEIVDSPIGFYHFVNDDQITLSLQAWSTSTLKEYCHAEGHGLHYDIDKAGIWTEPVHTKKPAIHNDYNSSLNKKGLPSGHAELIRELVVPVIRDDKVVAIVGVGNKGSLYTQRDVDIVSYIADVSYQAVLRKRSEEAIRESEAYIKMVLDNLPIGVAVNTVDPAIKFAYMNDRFPKIYRTTKEKLADQDVFWDVVYEDAEFRETLRKRVLDDVASGDSNRMHWEDIPLTRKDEPTSFISARNIMIPGRSLLLSTVWDVTELRRAEAERGQLLSAIEQAGEVIVITDVSATIQYVNPAFTTSTGYSRSEVIGHNPRILKSGKQDDHFYREMWDNLTNGETHRCRMVNKRKDGSLFTEEATISPVFSSDGKITYYVAVKRDITDQIRKEEQLLQAQKMESVGRLAGGVAHDFNNMLGVISGNAELALPFAQNNRQLNNYLVEILKATQHSKDLTRQLLAFARKQTIAPRVLDLNVLIGSTINMLRSLIGENIELAWVPEEGVCKVKVDPAQLKQLLVNLCTNAKDAISRSGKITIETHNVIIDESYTTSHFDATPGHYVLLEVSDSGSGMDKETLTYLFDPFFTTKDMDKGTGLGLSMVHGIVRQNNGFINVYSEIGSGSVFKVYLPRYSGADEEEQIEAEVPLVKGSEETILLVEDEPAILEVTKIMLENDGYLVLGANSPAEAIEIAKSMKGKIDLLITDVVMPGMNGRDLATLLKAAYPGLKCLFMSGYTANVIAHQGVLDTGVEFIQKPFSIKELATKVQSVLNKV